MNILAGDIGGTKTLLAIYNFANYGLNKLYQKKYKSLEWESFDSIISDFIENLPSNIKSPQEGCIGVAGIVTNTCCKVTNLKWEISSKEICEIAKLKSFELINDFSVLIYGLRYLKENQYINIQGTPKNSNYNENSLIAILGAGTGLGIARGLMNKNEIIALPSEGGHREFSPRNETEWVISKWLKKEFNLKRLSLEKVVSGSGLGNIARWRLMQDDANEHPLRSIADNFHTSNNVDFSQLASDYANSGDSLMIEALEIWLSAYGSAAGDMALQELCYGGLWIGGGSTIKQLKGIKSSIFLESFKNKGRFRNVLEKLPVMALTDPEVGLFSAGCRAYLLADKMGD